VSAAPCARPLAPLAAVLALAGCTGTPPAAISDQALAQELKTQFARCWAPPIPPRDVRDVAIELRVATNPDGSVREAKIASATGSDEAYARAAAEAALRAAHDPRCTPFKLPAGTWERWKSFTIVLTPKDLS
jgi:hypothetical protein